MKEIIINSNDKDQRLDRFMGKYLQNAKKSLIMKSIRKKNITVNNKKSAPEYILKENDRVEIYFSYETIEKFTKVKNHVKRDFPDIIYEDENIALVKKPRGLLTHNDKKDYEKNALDMFVSYMIHKGEYVPRVEKSFRPSFCNRLDRNTSGILIGCKNAQALREINDAIKNRHLEKHYMALVDGSIDEEIHDISYLEKDGEKNKVSLNERGDGKEIETIIRPMERLGEYTLVDINLITGRTHQIRATLKKYNRSIVGDLKYKGRRSFGLNSQFLHNYKIIFGGLKNLDYLNGKEFTLELEESLNDILKELRKEK